MKPSDILEKSKLRKSICIKYWIFGKSQLLRQNNTEESQCLCGKKFISTCCTITPTFPPTTSPVSQWVLPLTKDIRTGESVYGRREWRRQSESRWQRNWLSASEKDNKPFLLIMLQVTLSGKLAKGAEYVHLGFRKWWAARSQDHSDNQISLRLRTTGGVFQMPAGTGICRYRHLEKGSMN